MRHVILAAITIACAALWNSALAITMDVPRDEPLVTIDFPETWKVRHVDLSLSTGTPEGDLKVICQAVSEGTKATQKDISETFGQTLGESLYDFQISGKAKPAEETVVDGRKAFKSSASGTMNNQAANAVVCLIPIDEKSGLTLAYWGTPEAIRKHEAMIKAIIESVRRKAPR